jgi:hypothetical protein
LRLQLDLLEVDERIELLSQTLDLYADFEVSSGELVIHPCRSRDSENVEFHYLHLSLELVLSKEEVIGEERVIEFEGEVAVARDEID